MANIPHGRVVLGVIGAVVVIADMILIRRDGAQTSSERLI
jgi:hypothetical protein